MNICLVTIAPARGFDRSMCRQHGICLSTTHVLNLATRRGRKKRSLSTPRTAYHHVRRLSDFVVHALCGALPSSLVAQQGAITYKASPCPAGTFGTKPGAKSIADCTMCPAGSFCREGPDKAEVRHVLVGCHSCRLIFVRQGFGGVGLLVSIPSFKVYHEEKFSVPPTVPPASDCYIG